MVKPRTSAFPLASKSGTIKVFGLLAALLVFMTFAAQAAIRFDVWLGYGTDSVIPEASWFPVVCEVMNDGPTFMGVIEVSSGQFGGSQERRTIVELPTGTLKRIVIPVFSSQRFGSQWTVRLLDERGRVHAEQTGLSPKKQITAGATVVGAIPRTPNGVPVIRQILSRGQQQIEPVTVRLPPAILPDNPLVLEGMDTIYLSSEKAPELNSGQVNALLAWLNAGGHLVIGVEQISDVNATRWLRAIVPCDLTGMATVPVHGELQQWVRSGTMTTMSRLRSQSQPRTSQASPFTDLADDPAFEKGELQVATGTLRKGEAMVSAGDTPLILTSHEGRGLVTTMLFSPEREPFHSWKNLPSFWAKLAGVAADLYTNQNFYAPGGWSIDGVFGAMIDSKQIRKLPVEWLLLLLIAYLVVIGPLDQYWLKRIRRPMLTWITFPCYVVMFSLLIYFIGYKLRAGDTEWNELHLVDVLANGEGAELRGRTYASIYSPVNATYRVESQQHFSAFRGEFQSSWNGGGGPGTERAEVYQNGDNFKADIFVPVWTSQLYESDWWQSAPSPLGFTVDSEGSKWSVKVTNHCDKPFTNVRLFIAGRVMDLGELPAGAEKPFKFDKEQGQSLSDFVRAYAGNFRQASSQRMSAFGASGGGRILDVANGSMAASFVSRLSPDQIGNAEFVSPPGLDLYSVMEQGNAILLAWEPDYSPTKPLNQFPTRRGHRDTLWRVSIPINAAPTP